ncbi:hypothetical protein XENOCAPTIV_005339 [Xenoophorus captivus]|uniref:C2H2-type domain-containing protein n=1 Tax=Xenoophorus captivus TaxID=1517983 RepID=A0ABV0RFN4_9TELE
MITSLDHLFNPPYLTASLFTAFVPESFPLAELPTQNTSSVLTCQPSSPLFTSSDALPAPLSPITPVSLPHSPLGPLNLSSSPSSSSGDEEEDGGRTSDPPSPEAIQNIFHCLHCSKSYSCLSALSHHQVSNHQLPLNSPSSQTTSIPSDVSPRPAFHCKHCSKEYTSLGALKMHIRSHTLPCVCPTCGKAFSRPWLLRGHIRTHTGNFIGAGRSGTVAMLQLLGVCLCVC